jgi:hypothetical protein
MTEDEQEAQRESVHSFLDEEYQKDMDMEYLEQVQALFYRKENPQRQSLECL